ncbi:MAG: serine hydrolase [Nannocystaceae bacterium]
MPPIASPLRLALVALIAAPGACGGASAVDEARDAVVIAGPPPFAIAPRTEWPTEGWPTATPESVGVDPGALAHLADYAFARNGDDHDRKGQRTNALVIIKEGKLVFERYARGYTADTPLLTWSVSKSVAGTLVGRAVMDGRLDVNDPVARHYPPADRDGVREIRVHDLLRMSSGLDWNETYETSPIFSSVMAMLYTRGKDDMAAFVASHDLAHPPGTRWSYSSGDTMLMMGALRGAVGEEAWAEYPWTALFDKIGMRTAVWERDGAGTYVGSSYLYASARDLAKWAFLYLNDGVWAGERLLPEGWVAFSLTMAPAYYQTELTPGTLDDNPGAQVYLNVGDPSRAVPKPWPAAPDDLFAAQGHWGKSIFVIPSHDLIVVRLGDDRHYACDRPDADDGCQPDVNKAFSKAHFLELVMATVKR